MAETDQPLGCLTCRERAACWRGNCPRCYRRYKEAVATGETTWLQLEDQGLALPSRQDENLQRWTEHGYESLFPEARRGRPRQVQAERERRIALIKERHQLLQQRRH